MKTTLFVAVLAMFCISCKKDSFTIPDVSPQAELKASIFPAIAQPRVATLGDPDAVFNVGDQMTIFVPYEISRDELSKARLLIKDDAGEILNIYDMTNSTDLSAFEITVPESLQGASFVFATINLDELYAGKVVSIEAQVSGNHRTFDAQLPNAFSVQY